MGQIVDIRHRFCREITLGLLVGNGQKERLGILTKRFPILQRIDDDASIH